uniref:C2 domain-containing protein n=1 Tax=Kwoniella bestiolae CBS 10118 TaxID=1296100 RepID=A0A1B9G5N8_9TREE|nr:C2 domain-containing protein [Kwoniella bestiolae CBS 10118]OCF26349.1 C2 domain-containing protein [Kwoniella bestiolae CBS 10118]
MGDDKPAGGYDPTPVPPSSGPTYTVRITFHSASNLPVADFGSGSADPFVLAQVKTSQKVRHSHDPYLRWRSKTIRKCLEPSWESSWVIAGIPGDGLDLSARIYDEDPSDHDDRLGKVEVSTGHIDEGWKGIVKQEYKVKKTGADLRAYGARWACHLVGRRELHARLVLSIEVLGRTPEKMDVGKSYTVSQFWWVHYSPLIGRLAGVKGKDDKGVEKYNFQANELQLTGPVPNELYHRYVEFKTFVGGMFEATGLRGRVLNKALHHQHERIYNFDRQTKYGEWEYKMESGNDLKKQVTLKFLDMCHYDQGGRIFTYVITLDGLLRFTETGKEFGIDLLSKHTMHSDVNRYIAWSGEFLIRRLSHPDQSSADSHQRTHPPDPIPDGPPKEDPPKDPSAYELIIDNDSGTYRPDKKLIPVLTDFLKANFPGLKIRVMACDDDKLDKIKSQQRKVKSKEGDHLVFGQTSSVSSLGDDGGSISSSDEEDLDRRAAEQEEDGDGEGSEVKGGLERGVEALENPQKTAREGVNGLKEKTKAKGGKKEREEREERDDQA